MTVAGMALVPAVLLMATAGPAFESPAAAAAIATTISAAVGTPAPASAIPSAAAERPLET